MYRRAFLGSGFTAGVAALAGCLTDGDAGGPPPVPADRPDGVYRPGHAPRAVHVATRRAGPYAVGVLYSLPTRFWIVEGEHVERRSVRTEHDLHLMATVWDPETETVLPDTGVTVELARGGSASREVVYPMIDQRMGFHYGDNFALDGRGEYAVTVDVAGTAIARTGSFAGRFADPASATVTLLIGDDALADLSYDRPSDPGEGGALDPGATAIPAAGAPPVEALPGALLGTAVADGVLYAVVARDPPPGAATGADAPADATYLGVSARTRYNGLVVPAAGLACRVDRDGRTVHEGPLGRALDPDMGYHYGAVVPRIRGGDRVDLRVTTPPQVARHEGYETAFTDTATLSVEVS